MISSYQWHNFHLLCNPNIIISVRSSQLLHPPPVTSVRVLRGCGGPFAHEERVPIGPPPLLDHLSSPPPFPRPRPSGGLRDRDSPRPRPSACAPLGGLRPPRLRPPASEADGRAERISPTEAAGVGEAGGRARPESGELEVRFGRRKSRRGKSG